MVIVDGLWSLCLTSYLHLGDGFREEKEGGFEL
jgi:hypothetical protein